MSVQFLGCSTNLVSNYLKNQEVRPIYCMHYRWALNLNYYFKDSTNFNFYASRKIDQKPQISYIYDLRDTDKLDEFFH